MTKKQIVDKTAKFIKKEFDGENSGHDWWHIFRVWQIAKRIARAEKADLFIVEMAVLLHDLGDYKLEPDRKDRQEEKVSTWLKKMKVAENIQKEILHIVTNMSFSKNIFSRQELSLEGKVVQDADRLDAIGAIGVMRTFVYAAAHRIPPYDPAIKIRTFKSAKAYKKHEASAVNHFYEKLFLLKGKMNTKTAKHLALGRHMFMQNYLQEFFAEWKGIK